VVIVFFNRIDQRGLVPLDVPEAPPSRSPREPPDRSEPPCAPD